MNNIIQNILVFSVLAIAVIFLVKKYILPKPKSKKACGNDNNCGCH